MLHTILLTVLLLCILGTGIVAVIIPDLFSSVVLFGSFSFFVVLAYLMLSAPDVAFTEVVISVVSTAYFVTAVREFKKGER
ncbi:Na(+)/H(+) antiporter subunit B [Papillibacter cinnamivorans]|uniref:MrpA C-terminal/MbhD domain-containing protein n=1 Tax=Papillibacter cinnamivorans DSM 12816 TaxID=1122930 RepID=A0A1W2C4R3_9FIRM|nr:DUF4040 domain-containing protein [Papillibacter cinnamivorans]SMC80133.1 protein of unknown function [Papillibacter cinnamivorans DSM 12816]